MCRKKKTYFIFDNYLFFFQLNPSPPESIEDVPFRRQDRRILNARKKRVNDRKLIKCILLTGLVMILAGVALVITWAVIDDAGELHSSSFRLRVRSP